MPAGFDPSKLDPQALAELTRLVQELPPQQIMRMQTLMHNAMAGHDTRKDMEEFERGLPPGFREKLMNILSRHSATFVAAVGGAAPPNQASGIAQSQPAPGPTAAPGNEVREARLTILRAVAAGRMTPEDAETLL